MPRLESKAFPLEVKSVSGDGSEFEGLVAVFFNIDAWGDIFAPGCFKAQLDFFIQNGVTRDEHYVTTGKVLDAKEVAEGLWFKARISDTTDGKNQKILLKDGVYKFLSIGAKNVRQWLDGPEEVKAWWDSVGYKPSEQDLVRSAWGASLITASKPYEGSTTFVPANDKARIMSVKHEGPPAGRTFDAHSAEALAVLEEFTARAEQLAAKRKADGRSLSLKHAAEFKRLQDRLTGLLAATAAASASDTSPASQTTGQSDPPATVETKSLDPATLFAQFQATCARLNGVALN